MQHILVVEDESIIRQALRRLLERNDYQVTEAESVDDATAHNFDEFDMIISDLRLPGAEGTDIIELAPNTPVLIMTSYASMRSAVDAMKLGAIDYIAKPFDHDEMIRTVQRVLTNKRPIGDTANAESMPVSTSGLGEMIGSCDLMQTFYNRVHKVAPADITVLIHGESGTGKELAAKAIHDLSHRKDKALVCVNCAAIPESLIESELFGHEKGAFTGATSVRQGLVEAADGGTLFLDEIGELPLEAQARLLRVLQEQEVRRVGAVQSRKVDVRLVSATHRNLKQQVKQGLFREDLYYRLQVIEVTLPPLRDRGNDVVEIAQYLLEKHKTRMNLEQKFELTSDLKKALRHYTWPGNVRELENAMQRSLILSEDGKITIDLLGINTDDFSIPAQFLTGTKMTGTKKAEPKPAAKSQDNQTNETTEEINPDDLSLEDYFQHFVLEHQDHMSETELAQKLGVSRKCLWERRQRLGIPRAKKGTAS